MMNEMTHTLPQSADPQQGAAAVSPMSVAQQGASAFSPVRVARKVGSHRVVLPDGRVLRMAVVLLDADGRVLSHHPLDGEEPGVEWYPGVYHLPANEQS